MESELLDKLNKILSELPEKIEVNGKIKLDFRIEDEDDREGKTGPNL